MRLYFILFVLLLHISWAISQEPLSTIAKLRKDLLKNYDKKSRPVVQHQNTTVVHIDISPISITELDERKSIFDVDTWIKMHWLDEHLKWDPQQYEGLQIAHFADDELWHPDVSVYNGAESSIDPITKTIFVVFHNGDVQWVPPSKLRVLCSLNYQNYPQDVQQCLVKIGSWTSDGNKIDFQFHQELGNGSGDTSLEDFLDVNPLWKLERCQASRQVTVYACCPEPYVTVSFNFIIRRRGSAAYQAQRSLRRTAHVLVLSMFWLHFESIAKLIPGFVGVLCYVALIVAVTMTVPSPMAAEAAMSPLYMELYTILAAIIAVVLILNIANIRNLHLPHAKIFSSNIFRAVFCLCTGPLGTIAYDRVTTASASMSEELVNLETESVRIKQESVIVAAILERICFFVFLIVFLFTGSYL